MELFWQIMQHAVDFVRAVINISPESINQYATALGPWLYVVLFAIIFAETGLVVTPFLPGDSLLFAVGAIAAGAESPIHLGLVALLLVVAAILGDAVNYAIGFAVGPRIFSRENSRLLNKKHLLHARDFYVHYGAITIVLARFIPIIRTFAPFVAGIARMRYRKFFLYNVAGGTAWILLFLVAGWLFGGIPRVKANFKYVIAAILVLSVVPVVYEVWRARRGRDRPKPEPDTELA
jgi:membrane-associated protein